MRKTDHLTASSWSSAAREWRGDLRFGERLPGPVTTELGVISAADDTIGAVQPLRSRARTERVAAYCADQSQ
jgi:hypothetical protein